MKRLDGVRIATSVPFRECGVAVTCRSPKPCVSGSNPDSLAKSVVAGRHAKSDVAGATPLHPHPPAVVEPADKGTARVPA